jgi:hypothetical protein
VARAQVLLDLSGIRRRCAETVQARHALDGFLPALGRLANVGDAAHALLRIGLVTGAARTANQVVRHRQTLAEDAGRQNN